MKKRDVSPWILSMCVITVSIALVVLYVYDVDRFPFSFGLDLAGGTQVTYTADVSEVPEGEVAGRMSVLQRVIEQRVNALGVSEPNVYTITGLAIGGNPAAHRLVVELPGVTDTDEATKAIGETPYLEFKILVDDPMEIKDTGLQGTHITTAEVQFLPGIGGTLTNEPVVVLHFNGEGGKIFAEVTRDNVGRRLMIFLDGAVISSPVINEPITGGTTQIQGNFTLDSAKELVDGLNLGALPLPIELSETLTVNPSLGAEVSEKSVFAGLIALLLIALLFIGVYRFVGIVAVLALAVYCIIVLAIFKAVPIVLTAAGLSGFIMSIGFAVDANVLIFERMREEISRGETRVHAIRNGCARAWVAIRDANLTSMIIAFLLFWFGTSMIKGFAFAFIIGVLISMFSAYVLTRLFLRATASVFSKRLKKWYIQ
ncbi:MAG: protein translocase subunit SecD [Candidatus Kaiserbacteria bacterium]|nr:protein translocase subunit SecD [Candidatus Kaiserbacteria bacterium]